MDARRAPTEAELVELHDRLWNDLRCRDDRSDFHECESCGRAVRWVRNLGSASASSLQVVARPVATAAFFDVERHAGLVAVYTDRTGFTVARATTVDDVDGAFLYECHWDVCEDARTIRDRMSRERSRRLVEEATGSPATDVEAIDRYAAWRATQQG